MPSGAAGKQQASSPAVQKKEEQGQSNVYENVPEFLSRFQLGMRCRNPFRNSGNMGISMEGTRAESVAFV